MGLHALDMFNRYNQNRYWPESRRKRRSALRKMYADSVDSRIHTTGQREVAPETLEEIKTRIREQVRRDRRRRIIFSAVVGGGADSADICSSFFTV